MLDRGFIDLHTHGIGRYSTKDCNCDDLLRMAELYSKAGTTAFLPTIYSGTIEDMRMDMEAVKQAMVIQSRDKVRNRSRAGGQSSVEDPSLILGVHLEGPFLNPLMAGAQKKETFIRPTVSNLRRLVEGYEEIIRIITIAPELEGATRLIERCVDMGIIVNMGHSDATYREALNGKKAGAKGITHIFNAMRAIHHREMGLAGFGLVDDDIYIEVIADGIHIDMNMLRLVLRVKDPERVILVSDSIGGGRFKKRGRLLGSPMNLREAFRNLQDSGISVSGMERFIYQNPARYLSLPYDEE